jgi:hypothetical protein
VAIHEATVTMAEADEQGSDSGVNTSADGPPKSSSSSTGSGSGAGGFRNFLRRAVSTDDASSQKSNTVNSTASTASHRNSKSPAKNEGDHVSLGSQESMNPRWSGGPDNAAPPKLINSIRGGGPAPTTPKNSSSKSPTSVAAVNNNSPKKPAEGSFTSLDNSSPVLWFCIRRDQTTILSEVGSQYDQKVLKASRRLLKKDPKLTGEWDYYTYAIESQRRHVSAVNFSVYEYVPLAPGSRARLVGLQKETFLNHTTVRVIEYDVTSKKYLIRPTVPLHEDQKLSATGQLLVHRKFVAPLTSDTTTAGSTSLVAPTPTFRIWTYSMLYHGKTSGSVGGWTKTDACAFLERVVLIASPLQAVDKMWLTGGNLACQHTMQPILQALRGGCIEESSSTENLEDDTSLLEYSRDMLMRNKLLQDERQVQFKGLNVYQQQRAAGIPVTTLAPAHNGTSTTTDATSALRSVFSSIGERFSTNDKAQQAIHNKQDSFDGNVTGGFQEIDLGNGAEKEHRLESQVNGASARSGRNVAGRAV